MVLKGLVPRTVGDVDMLPSDVVDSRIVSGLSRDMAVLGRRRAVTVVGAEETIGDLSVARMGAAGCAIPGAGFVQGELFVRDDEAFEDLVFLNGPDAFLEGSLDPEVGLRVPNLEAGETGAPIFGEDLVEERGRGGRSSVSVQVLIEESLDVPLQFGSFQLGEAEDLNGGTNV